MDWITLPGEEVPWWWPGVVRSDQSREDVSFEEAVSDVRSWIPNEPVPLAFGITAVAVPYVAGAAIVAFAPPWWKPAGMAMLVPSPMDAAYFSAGYSFGQQVEDWF